MPNSNAIEHVQEAEAKAKRMVEDAERRRADRIQKANERAAQTVEEAEAKTKQIREEAIKKAGAEAEAERSRRLSEAGGLAKRLQKRELGHNKIREVVDKVVRQIFG
jgi:vacuolar-type H+-ATPase subunit H